MVAEGQCEEELLEVLVLWMRRFEQLIGRGRLESVQVGVEYLRLIGQVLERFAIVFIACL